MLRLFFILMIVHSNSFSHPGRLAADGCHYCRKNCSKHGLTAGERHNKDGVKCESSEGSSYQRKLFGGWTDRDGNCLNTRHEILLKESLIPVTKRACLVVTGKWADFYYDEFFNKANEVDIDHIVSLKEAWESGAREWTSEKRAEFANDPENLAITKKERNRRKSAKNPLNWLPVNRAYACKFMKRWIDIKTKYQLRIDPKVLEYKSKAECSG